ncbi:hypothetical protein BDV27DRAFT_134769 [Aspergillus caelatus]|uniref:Uncharacterized protein n=1 Tax=Aspergillus caelatus TaxID=61420 RepID=A0A5N6ZRQ3_9EURO|nr:uncharacterized protein BDV27DRAFT_134769 [Aspergillus caelatus]KAE8360254.1 hypothetical protein BDV27DRAFT_134769 [Aspergillus caelatus]
MVVLPKQTLLARTSTLRLYDNIIYLRREQHHNLEWEYHPLDILASPPKYRCSIDDGLTVGCDISDQLELHWHSGNLASHSLNTQSKFGRAAIVIMVKPPRTLLPTFYGSLVARSYSLLLHVYFKHNRIKNIDLEIPLQVTHLQNAKANGSIRSGRPTCRCTRSVQPDVLPTYESTMRNV